MKINEAKNVLPCNCKSVLIINKEMTDIKESWVISFHDNTLWSSGGPPAYGGPLGLTFEDYPYWILKEDFLETIKADLTSQI